MVRKLKFFSKLIKQQRKSDIFKINVCHEHYLWSDLHFLIVVLAESLNNIEKLRKLCFSPEFFHKKSHTKHYFPFDPHLVIEHGHKVEIVSSEGIDTAITYTNFAICFLDKAHVNKMKQKFIFIPVIGFRYLNINGFKRLQPLMLEWQYRPAIPKLECDPNLSLANILRLSSFLIPAIYSFLEYMQYRHR